MSPGEGAGSGSRGEWKRILPWAAGAAVLAVHLLLTFHFLPPSIVFDDRPVPLFDHELHAGEVWAVTGAMDGWGRSWAYDPLLLAGYPAGALFNVGGHGRELFVFVLWKLGVDRAVGFNVSVLLAHLLLPLVVWWSARLFDLGRWSSVLGVLFAVLLWHFDSFTHGCWWVGMVTFATAGYGVLLPLAALYRWIRQGRWPVLALLAGSLAAVHLIHPFAFCALAVPMGVMWLRSRRDMDLRRHAGIGAAILFTLAANLWWILVALRFLGDVAASPELAQGTPATLLVDLLGLQGDPVVTGWCGVRTTFRTLSLLAAAACLVRWRGKRDDRFLPFATGIGTCLALAYLGSLVPPVALLEPYRFVVPAMMLSVIPAAGAAVTFGARLADSALVRGIAVILAAAMLSMAARDVTHFFDQNRVQVASRLGTDECVACTGRPERATDQTCRHRPLPADFDALARMLGRREQMQGRILVEDWMLAEHLAWRTRAHVLGGLIFKAVRQRSASLFVRMREGPLDGAALRRYLEDYAVRWILVSTPHPEIEQREDLMVRVGSYPYETMHGETRHRLYRTKIDVSFLVPDQGSVRASLNRIDVSSTDPDTDVVLRFHHMDSLVCVPGCTVAKEPVIGDPAGFIRVAAPHAADFSIVNGY